MHRMLAAGLAAGFAMSMASGAGASEMRPQSEAALSTPVADLAPDLLLSNATLVVTDYLKQNRNLPGSAQKLTELVEATVLPLFDFRHMTQLAVARNWRVATAAQQDELVSVFRMLLVRTYTSALTSYRDQPINYRPLRIPPGVTEVTVKSSIRQPGSEPTTIDYDMEKTAAGWKVYDIKFAGVSLITTYRSSFADSVRDGGIDGLIRSITAKNQQRVVTLDPRDESGRQLMFIYTIAPTVLRGAR
jgi:phospholipid transport system substrate-binding protein